MYFYNCPFFQNKYRFAIEEDDIIEQPDIFGTPDIMGQQEYMLEQQGLTDQQLQQQGMQGQLGVPSQQQGMVGQQGLPSQQQGMVGQQGLPSQQQGMTGQPQIIPTQQDMMTDIMSDMVSQYTYPDNFQEGLDLIRGAITWEREEELLYNYLISIAPTQASRTILESIRNDERRHNQLFRGIYFKLTGRRLPPSQGTGFERPTSYCDGIKRALLGELDTVQRYRRIVFALQDRVQVNMLVEIITDELRHGSLYNLLYSEARCFQQNSTRF